VFAQDDDDDTIRFVPPAPKSRPRFILPLLALGALFGVAGLGGVGWLLLNPSPTPVAPQQAPPAAPLADEAAILAARSSDLLIFRYRDAPAVLVLSFPSLRQQGDMLDRMAAFVEKAGLPHDRLLTDAELDAAIAQSGDTRETYYYGHDYRAADMARFFATAGRNGIALNPEEERLRALLKQAGLLTPDANGALISIPPEVESEQIDASSRGTILHHELSHGVYFTDPAYADYAKKFWQTGLNDIQRAGFRRFLGNEGYDITNDDLVINETQAYLAHTLDARYFAPSKAGLSVTEAAGLREAFIRNMPEGWLKAAAKVAKPVSG
jgi:hypothetical protein